MQRLCMSIWGRGCEWDYVEFSQRHTRLEGLKYCNCSCTPSDMQDRSPHGTAIVDPHVSFSSIFLLLVSVVHKPLDLRDLAPLNLNFPDRVEVLKPKRSKMGTVFNRAVELEVQGYLLVGLNRFSIIFDCHSLIIEH